MFKLFEIKDGKFTTLPQLTTKNIKASILASIIILVVVSLSLWLKIDQKDIWKFYNLLIQQFGLQKEAPKIDRQKELESRVEIEVDKAIRNVEPEYNRIIAEADKKYKPRYMDLQNDESVCYTEDCKKLAPPMRICAPWIKDCV